MRITFSFVIVLLLVASIVAEENEDRVDVKSTTKRNYRGKKKDLNLDCSETSDEDHIGYTCKSKTGDEAKPIGIQFFRSNGFFYCGQFDNDQLDGQGFLFYTRHNIALGMYCGGVVKRNSSGLGHYINLRNGIHNLGHFHDDASHNRTFVYWPWLTKFGRYWFENGKCKSVIGYDSEGAERVREGFGCPSF